MFPIKKIVITKLFNEYDIKLEFNSNVFVIVGANGLGKSTALNIINLLLTRKFSQLPRFIFESIQVWGSNNKKFTVSNDEIKNYVNYSYRGNHSYYLNRTSSKLNSRRRIENDFELIESLYNIYSLEINRSDINRRQHTILEIADKIHHTIRNQYPEFRIHIRNIIELVEEIEYKKLSIDDKVIKLDKYLTEVFTNYEIIFLPTYRRIEADLKQIGITLKDEDEKMFEKTSSMKFGMRDIVSIFDSFENKQKIIMSTGLVDLSRDLFKHIIENRNDDNHSYTSVDVDQILKVAMRFEGSGLTTDMISQLKTIIQSETYQSDKILRFILNKIYELILKLKEIDDLIINFANMCNKYLEYSNTRIQYSANENNVYIIKNKNTFKFVDFVDKLSSGEKQIISLFSKVLIENQEKNVIILIDEPEISLSINWQETILKDLTSYSNCKMLVAVTHSPFIFENSKIRPYAKNIFSE